MEWRLGGGFFEVVTVDFSTIVLLVTMPHFRLDGLFDAFVGVVLQVLTCASPHGSDLGLSWWVGCITT
jgi:hypothetical protein